MPRTSTEGRQKGASGSTLTGWQSVLGSWPICYLTGHCAPAIHSPAARGRLRPHPGVHSLGTAKFWHEVSFPYPLSSISAAQFIDVGYSRLSDPNASRQEVLVEGSAFRRSVRMTPKPDFSCL